MVHKIKIVRIIARLNIGGPSTNVSILSTCIDKDIFHTKILYGSLAEGESGLEHLMKEKGVDMELIPELGREINPLDDLVALWKIFKIVLREKPDIVHTHTAKAGTLGRIAAICAGTKVRIHTFHGNVFKHYFGKVKTTVFIIIERVLGLFTTKVVTISQKQKEEIVKEFKIVSDKKCVVIPLGVDFTKLRNMPIAGTSLKRELGLGDDTLLVGILGRLVPVKNHKMFLESAAKVRKEYPEIDVKFVVVGGGELEKELKALTDSLGIGKDVYFLGWRQDLGNIYRGLDVVALTSLNEGTPLALIEAMAMARAIISTNVGGVSDIIVDGSTGLLVDKNDVNGFVKGLLNILSDRVLMERLGCSALAASERFDKVNLVNAATKLYLDCVKA